MSTIGSGGDKLTQLVANHVFRYIYRNMFSSCLLYTSIAGKDKDKEGKVLSVDQKNGRVLVEGVNMVTKHAKPSAANQNGGICLLYTSCFDNFDYEKISAYEEAKIEEILQMPDMIRSRRTVSYTHLDVYKRQVMRIIQVGAR